MSSIHSVTACLIPSSDGYSSGQERVWEDRDEFLGEEQRRKERREAERGRGREGMNRVEIV